MRKDLNQQKDEIMNFLKTLFVFQETANQSFFVRNRIIVLDDDEVFRDRIFVLNKKWEDDLKTRS